MGEPIFFLGGGFFSKHLHYYFVLLLRLGDFSLGDFFSMKR